jgi:hypothetical protein
MIKANPLLDDDIDFIVEDYMRDGYAIVRGALSAEEMVEIQAQWQRLRDPLRAGQVVDGIRRDHFYVHGRLPSPVGDVYRHPRIVRIAERLLGPNIALYLNRLNVKDEMFVDNIHLHQDMPYFNGGQNKVNFFVALQDINLNNGAMVFVAASQKLGILDRNTIDIGKHPELEVAIPGLRPGDLVIADIKLWHSSVPNAAGTDRVLLQMMFQPGDDGSYYPSSVPNPLIVAGEWETSEFVPWEAIEPVPHEPSMIRTARQVAAVSSSLRASAATRLKAAVPVWVKQPIRDVLYGAPRRGPRVSLARRIKAVVPVSIKQPIRDFVYGAPGGHVGSAVAGAVVQTPSSSARVRMRELPKYFTASTGPEQVWSLTEDEVDWPRALEPAARYLAGAGKSRVLLAARRTVAPDVVAAARAFRLDVVGYVQVTYPGEADLAQGDGRPVYTPEDMPRLAGIDAIVILCSREFGLVLRRCEQFLRDDILFIPGAIEAIVPEPVRSASVGDWGLRSSILTYLYAAGMRGNFAEFGTFWGRAFFSSYYELHHWLHGRFFAFDSFAGLSEPQPDETKYTNGDFVKGAYGFNRDSFEALTEILGLPRERIVTAQGFFATSLSPRRAAELRLEPKSLSVCRIDCDLLEPTLAVLDFVAPLLDDGALIYFDDWRLCRADPNLGERGAVLRWLEANPSYELIDFHSIHWQHQWFIFHRNRQRRA